MDLYGFSPILNFITSQSEIRLSDNSVISLPTDKEKKVIHELRSIWGYAPDWKFVFRTSPSRKVSAKKRGEIVGILHERLENFGITLKLFKSGKVGLGYKCILQTSPYDVLSCSQHERILIPNKTDVYSLKKHDLSTFAELYDQVTSFDFDKHNHLRIAIERYSMAFEEGYRSSPIDLIVGFEALYLGEELELSNKLAMRAAYLLGNSKEHRIHIYRALKKAYKIRNNLVHGKEKMDKFVGEFEIDKGKFIGIVEFLDYISNLLRESIIKFIEFAPKYSHDKLTKTLLDDNIFVEGTLLRRFN